VWFILGLYITYILISTTFRFECISGLIKVTDNNDAQRKLEKGNYLLSSHQSSAYRMDVKYAEQN
jgi:hypothetical protein